MSTNPVRDEAENLVTTVLAVADAALRAAAVREQAQQLRDVAGWLVGAAQTATSRPAPTPGAAGPGAAPGAGAAETTNPAETAKAGAERTTEAGAAGHAGSGPADAAGHRFATGSAECCVCPVCRVITALRDPDPAFVERLVDGVGELGSGLAAVLRAFSEATAAPGGAGTPTDRADAGRAGAGEHGDPWRAATTAARPGPQTATQAATPRSTARQAARSPVARTVARKVAARKAAAGQAAEHRTGGDTAGKPA